VEVGERGVSAGPYSSRFWAESDPNSGSPFSSLRAFYWSGPILEAQNRELNKALAGPCSPGYLPILLGCVYLP
jgi:hypothetical protein